ncbi:MAG: urate oxidase [Catenulispora sp.]|nr:urate oxidase [Catenulispora sp.]
MDDIVLETARYGKAEVRVVRIAKDGAEHSIRDLNVSVALSGDQADTHLTGDNAKVLTTDAQKNAVYSLAAEHGISSPEHFALVLVRHFLATCPFISHARIAVEEFAWDRIPGATSRHSFLRLGQETRTALVHGDADGTVSVVSGLKDLVVLNSTDSEFHGFFKDPHTTLPETSDRVLATAVDAAWRHETTTDGWDESYARARAVLLTAFADTYSYSLQQTLYAMGEQLLRQDPGLGEVRLSLPNRHHFAVDLTPFGQKNDNEVFYAADRPYGLIEGTLRRRGASAPGRAWD